MIEIVSIIVALISLVASIAALILSALRVKLAEKSLQMQALIQFRTSASQTRYSEGIAIIGTLQCDNYDEFLRKMSDDNKFKILSCIEHLNFVSNLVEAGYVKKQSAWDIYFMSYRLVGQKLYPWWFKGISEMTHPNRLVAAQRMIVDVLKITDKQIHEFDQKRLRKLA